MSLLSLSIGFVESEEVNTLCFFTSAGETQLNVKWTSQVMDANEDAPAPSLDSSYDWPVLQLQSNHQHHHKPLLTQILDNTY